jgi:hypothetical protein
MAELEASLINRRDPSRQVLGLRLLVGSRRPMPTFLFKSFRPVGYDPNMIKKLKTCAFCGTSGKSTGEHVFGDCLSRLGLDVPECRFGPGPVNRSARDLDVSFPFSRKVRDVCNSWMSNLESVACRGFRSGRFRSIRRLGQETSEVSTTSWNCSHEVMVELPKMLTSTVGQRLM